MIRTMANYPKKTVYCGCGGVAKGVTPNHPVACNKCGNLLGLIVDGVTYHPVAWITKDKNLTVPPRME